MTAPRLVVDAASDLAPWRQVHDQLADLVDLGTLAAGSRLPAIRRLARDLDVAPGTIARAYRELEASGRVRTARGGGTRVADPTSGGGSTVAGPAATGPDRLDALARSYLAAARAAGADPARAVDAVRAAAGAPADR